MLRRKPRKPVPRFNCPNCGAEVKITAKSCPECGADDETGWKDEAYSGAYRYDDDFDYDEFVSRELGGSKVKSPQTSWWVWVLALLLAAAFTLMTLR